MSAMSHRAFLRTATRRAHDAAEAAWPSVLGMQDESAYRAWLRAMLHVHRAIGLPSALRLEQTGLIAAERARISAIEGDLRQPPASAPGPSPRPVSWAWGAQYALSGSAMGASAILKASNARSALPRTYLRTMRAFAVSGDLKRFFADLDRCDISQREALQGAEAVFSMMLVTSQPAPAL